MYDLKSDEEFCFLVYKIDQAAYDALEENIFDNGCNEPICVWNKIIIDGNKRYEICKKWGLPFKIQRMDFTSRPEAVRWICREQLQRTDVPDEMRKYLIGKYYEAAKDIYLAGLDEHLASKVRGYQYKIAEEISTEVYLVPGTIYKYGIYTRAIDNIASKCRNMAEYIISGKLRISQNNIIELSRLPKEEVRALNNSLTKNNVDRISYSEMRHELHWQRLPTGARARKKDSNSNVSLPIKEVPAYDPDAEISSLTLTIPSWISSIERTRSMADFSVTTAPAREKLLHEIFALHKAIFTIQKILEEADNNG